MHLGNITLLGEQLLIQDFINVQIFGENATVYFHGNSSIEISRVRKLNVEGLSFIGASLDNTCTQQSFIINGATNVTFNECLFSGLTPLCQTGIGSILDINNINSTNIVNTVFVSNTGKVLNIDAELKFTLKIVSLLIMMVLVKLRVKLLLFSWSKQGSTILYL